ncbi:MAG: folylpolyglutamate synthase/dihydrofolate synthase family protein [Alphaproteobacteria bacterium]|nr:folylpolyglutamate synthase/dihydrofolate synthase family protein [Alphaproteobacteria bacterium]
MRLRSKNGSSPALHPEKIHNKSNDPALEQRLKDILTLLYSFYEQEIDMSLERVGRFLSQLGNPQLKLPPVIHVAGTNGKGSTVATLRSLLEASGKRVHVMTSPHLIHPTERVRLAGELISTESLIGVLEECLAINRQEPITFFEMLTAASFLAMARTPADYTILETGMGGRLDATNVVPNPVCTIITTISKDHEKFLGDTLKKIAFEKAGIMKAGVPCVIGYQTPEAIKAGVLNVFHDVSQALSPDAELVRCGAEWQSEAQEDRLKFTWHGHSILTSRPNLIGAHQIYNAGAALAAYRIIMGNDFDAKILSPDVPNNPLLTIHWPGRLQKLQSHPFNEIAPNAEIWIDGGHNDSAGVFLAEQARTWQEQDGKPLHLVVAMVNRKNPSAFLEPLVTYVQSLTCTEIENEPSSYGTQNLYDLCQPLGFKSIQKTNTPEEAVRLISKNHPRDRILITGSLYLLGTILS